jgi:hypothetical protein
VKSVFADSVEMGSRIPCFWRDYRTLCSCLERQFYCDLQEESHETTSRVQQGLDAAQSLSDCAKLVPSDRRWSRKAAPSDRRWLRKAAPSDQKS